VRHLLAAYDLSTDKLYGHIKARKGRTEFLAFMKYLRGLYPPHVRIAVVLDNYSPHLSTKKDNRVGTWAGAHNVELATCRSTARGSTGSRLSSPPCATSPSTEPTTPATPNRPA
jgi:hypothetical protein